LHGNGNGNANGWYFTALASCLCLELSQIDANTRLARFEEVDLVDLE
jgi:hypothetical protein